MHYCISTTVIILCIRGEPSVCGGSVYALQLVPNNIYYIPRTSTWTIFHIHSSVTRNEVVEQLNADTEPAFKIQFS